MLMIVSLASQHTSLKGEYIRISRQSLVSNEVLRLWKTPGDNGGYGNSVGVGPTSFVPSSYDVDTEQ